MSPSTCGSIHFALIGPSGFGFGLGVGVDAGAGVEAGAGISAGLEVDAGLVQAIAASIIMASTAAVADFFNICSFLLSLFD